MERKNKIIIKAELLYDGKTKLKNQFITIENDRITDVSSDNQPHDFEGVVTPAFIDPHSHIGMDRDGEPYEESEVNDNINQILPAVDPLNSIYFDDRAFKDAVDFGVLYSCVVPGSGNLIGGKAVIIRNFAANREEAHIKDYGFKMALGYNPRSTTEWKGDRPNTRMGVYSMLENHFDEVIIKKEKALLEKEKKLYELDVKKKKDEIDNAEYDFEKKSLAKEYELEFSPEDKEILDILSGDKTIKVHVHKEDDVLYLLKLVEKYKLKVTADHTCDVFHQEIFEKLGQKNIPIVYGPIGGIGYKVELKHAFYENTKLLIDSKAFFGLMTDHPVVHSRDLRNCLQYFLIQGLSEEDSIEIITHNNAKILGLENDLGTIEKGKLASLTVWDKNPFHMGSYPVAVIGEGKILRKR